MPVPPNALRSATYQASMSRSESQSPAYSPKLQPGLSSIFSRFTGRSRSSSSPAQHKKAIAANSPTSAATGNANGGIEDAKDRLASILASAKHHHQDPQNISSSSSSAKRKKGQTADVPPVFGAAADAELSDQGPYAPTSPFIILDLLSRTSKGDRSDERLACIQSLCDAVILFDEVDALQVWLSAPASALLDTAVEPVCVRLAGIRLLVTCISASESSLHLASRKIAYYNFICRYGKDSKDCSDEELEALTEALSVLCKGGRDVSALDGLVERICDFAGEKFKRRQAQRDQFRVEFFAKHPYFSRLLTDKDSQHINTPLLDPHHASVFVSWPVAAAEARTPGTSSLTLLTNIHKFSFPLLSEEAVAFSTAYLVAEALATSNDGIISRILEHMDSISKFGYVPTSQIQGVVFLLARIVATEGSQRHLCFIDDEGNELSEPVLKPLPPHLSNEAKRVINNLLRSTANQALAQLREGTKPPSSESSHDENVVVGCLKCLRLAMAEIRASMKHTSVEAAANSTYFDSWPIILSFGIPLFFNNMWDALDCPHPAVTLEVLHIITDRLVMLQEFESPHVLPDGGNETVFMNPRSISFEEWDMILDLFREVLRNIQRLEEDDKVLWILNLTAARPDINENINLLEDDSGRDVQSAVFAQARRVILFILNSYLKGSFEGSTDRLFYVFYCLGPNLTDESVVMLLDGYSNQSLCLPSNAEWLEDLHDIVYGFLMTDAADIYSGEMAEFTEDSVNSQPQRPIRPRARLRSLQLVLEVYESVRDFDDHRGLLCDRVILPTLEYMLNTQVEPNEVTTLSQLVISVVRDALNAFPNHPDTSQKLLNGVQVAMTEATASSPSHELATIQLLEIFTVCLTSEEAGSSAEAVNIFRRLLSILGEPATPRRSRLVILQYVLRLRATASHRVTLVHDIDITGLAEALGRSQPIPTPRPAKLNEDPVVPKDEENERSSSRRGRCPQANDPPDRQESRSKSRIRFKDRNASLQPRVPRDPIWYIPEDVPFSTPIESAEGTEHLVSFDHTLEWSDSEDDREDDNFNSYDSALADRPSNAPTLLPVSEYIFTLKRIIQEDSDWDLVAYILCHLPVQLSCKHFFAGPRASRQLKLFRNLLVEGLMSSNFAAQTLLPEGNRRADLPSLAYHTLATLVAYKSLFSKLEQDEMVQTFATGLTQREVAKPCIHALAMACHELKPSMTKHLSQILSNLLKIMSSARMAVHILELIASISHLPSLFSSFTTDDYRTVLGIALQYITLHNDKTSLRHPNPDSTEESTKAEELAFHQYVFHLAYIVIEQWYMRMKLSQRRQQVPFIIRKLLQANESRGRLDEASQVCVDMLARYATCDLDSRPRPSQLQGLLSSSKASQSCSRTWLQGHAVITITCLPTARWAEVTVRRPSGVAQLLMEVGNAPEACTTAVSADMLETLLSQRADILSSAPTDLSQRLGDLTADRVLTLERIKEVLGAVDWQRPSGKDLVQDQKDDSTQGGPASAATPSFFTLQLSSYPEFGNAGPPLLLPHEDRYQRTVRNLDSVPVVDFHKIGIVYVGQDDLTECDILSNTHGSKGYVRLLADLGQIVRLQGNDDYYLGGLDRENDLDGKWTYVWASSGIQLVFHVATMMPTSRERDPQCIGKKRHIGNDFVKVIYNDSGRPFRSDMLPGQFNFVDIVVEPQTPAGKSWTARGMSSNTGFFKVSMQRRTGMPEIGPLGVFKMVSDKCLGDCVRQLALHANIFAQVFLETVGIEGGPSGVKSKTRYVSNWQRRLQYISQLRERMSPVDHTSSSPVPETQSLEHLFGNLDVSRWI